MCVRACEWMRVSECVCECAKKKPRQIPRKGSNKPPSSRVIDFALDTVSSLARWRVTDQPEYPAWWCLLLLQQQVTSRGPPANWMNFQHSSWCLEGKKRSVSNCFNYEAWLSRLAKTVFHNFSVNYTIFLGFFLFLYPCLVALMIPSWVYPVDLGYLMSFWPGNEARWGEVFGIWVINVVEGLWSGRLGVVTGNWRTSAN